MTTRREFLRRTAIVGGAVGAGIVPARLAANVAPGSPPVRAGRPPRDLRILVLGGTGFIGPHLVRHAVERGHTLTLFNRGRSEPSLFAEAYEGIEALVGDRDGDLSALEGGEWDVVIDNSGYTPDQVGATARLLRGRARQYVFTSTRAVYADFTHSTMDEDAPIGIPGVPEEEWTGYGPLKALAEREVAESFPDGTAIVRPPIITGPGDTTDRFTYWYVRVDRGGEVLAPGDPTDPVQYVDVRDLVDFFLHLAEQGTTGVFNPEAPAAPLSSAEFLHGLRAVTASPVRFTWVDWDFLAERGLRGGQEIPAWRAPEGAWLNYGRMDNRRAMAAGMTFRPLALTARDTLAWWRGREEAEGAVLRAGILAEREVEVLSEWHRSRPT